MVDFPIIFAVYKLHTGVLVMATRVTCSSCRCSLSYGHSFCRLWIPTPHSGSTWTSVTPFTRDICSGVRFCQPEIASLKNANFRNLFSDCTQKILLLHMCAYSFRTLMIFLQFYAPTQTQHTKVTWLILMEEKDSQNTYYLAPTFPSPNKPRNCNTIIL